MRYGAGMRNRAWASVVMVFLLLTGCSTDAARQEVADAAGRFVGAPAAAACSLLAPETRKAMEQESGSECPVALTEAGLPSSSGPVRVEIAAESAQVQFTDQTLFLARFPEGWLVTAAGCHRQDPDPAVPYRCEVKP